MDRHEAIVLFDGTCGFCNRGVRWLISRDRAARLRFAPLQSPIGQKYLSQFGLPPDYLESLVLIEPNRASTNSTGSFRILSYLPYPWKLLAGFLLVPRFIRDIGYRFVAMRRHSIVKNEACPIPTPEQRARFIDQMPFPTN